MFSFLVTRQFEQQCLKIVTYLYDIMDLNSFISGEKPVKNHVVEPSLDRKTTISKPIVPKMVGQVKIQTQSPSKPLVKAPQPWIVKYLPPDTGSIIGRDDEIIKLRKYISDFPRVKKRAIFLCGPAGSGKTSCVHALAKELDYELFEINASDARNKSKLQEILVPATKQKSFFFKGKIILVDEVDGLSGTKDRGGIPELAKIIAESAVPIVLTANLIDPQKFKPLLKVVESIEMAELPTKTISSILATILSKEKIMLDENAQTALKTLSVNCDGDARAAINDLQMLVVDGKINPDRLEMVNERKRTQSIETFVGTVLKGTDAHASYMAAQDIHENFDTQMLWLDYNMGKEYTKPLDLARAYGALSKADVFRRRVMKNQEWRFMLYAQILATSGLTVAKTEPYKTHSFYTQTPRLLKIWQVNMSNAKRKTIAQKIADGTHCSAKVAFGQIDYYKIMFKQKSSMCDAISNQLEFDDAERSWLSR